MGNLHHRVHLTRTKTSGEDAAVGPGHLQHRHLVASWAPRGFKNKKKNKSTQRYSERKAASFTSDAGCYPGRSVRLAPSRTGSPSLRRWCGCEPRCAWWRPWLWPPGRKSQTGCEGRPAASCWMSPGEKSNLTFTFNVNKSGKASVLAAIFHYLVSTWLHSWKQLWLVNQSGDAVIAAWLQSVSQHLATRGLAKYTRLTN